VLKERACDIIVNWHERDHQVAAGILSACEESILAGHIHLLDLPTRRAATIYYELSASYEPGYSTSITPP